MGFYAERVFPWLLDGALRGRAVDAWTRDALAPARGEVLEIGFGTARTLPHYPDAVDVLHAVEPSVGMSRRAQQRIERARMPVVLTPGVGETLPYPDGRFDTVTLIFTLCSVRDPGAVLSEAKRVLRPGGRLLMLEHVANAEPRWATWQRRLTPIQKVVGCGCVLTRHAEAEAERAGFVWHNRHTALVPEFPGKPELFPLFRGEAMLAG
jgi:ubiquinone/menaquinone biosynthesis C-methylase UbiE